MNAVPKIVSIDHALPTMSRQGQPMTHDPATVRGAPRRRAGVVVNVMANVTTPTGARGHRASGDLRSGTRRVVSAVSEQVDARSSVPSNRRAALASSQQGAGRST